jgi:hypothetical protein
MDRKKFKLKRESRLPGDLLESPAYYELKGEKTLRVLIRFYQKRRWTAQRKKIEYIDEPMAFTYAEAKTMGIGPSRFHEIISELYCMGFIEISHIGGGLARDYSRYTISTRWRDYGTDKFKPREKPRTVRPGRDVQTLKQRKAQASQGGIRSDNGTDSAKQVTLDRNCQLRPTVTIDAEASDQGSAAP